MGENNPKTSHSPWDVDPSNAPMPGPTLLNTQTAARSLYALSHSFATNSLVVIVWRPTSTLKSTPNDNQIHSAIFPQSTGQTDRQTDRQAGSQTDGPWQNCSINDSEWAQKLP